MTSSSQLHVAAPGSFVAQTQALNHLLTSTSVGNDESSFPDTFQINQDNWTASDVFLRYYPESSALQISLKAIKKEEKASLGKQVVWRRV